MIFVAMLIIVGFIPTGPPSMNQSKDLVGIGNSFSDQPGMVVTADHEGYRS